MYLVKTTEQPVYWIMANYIQGGSKKVSHKVFSISLSNIDRFLNFFSLAHSVENL